MFAAAASGLLPFLFSCDGYCSLAPGPERFFSAFPPAAQFFLSFAHGWFSFPNSDLSAAPDNRMGAKPAHYSGDGVICQYIGSNTNYREQKTEAAPNTFAFKRTAGPSVAGNSVIVRCFPHFFLDFFPPIY